MKSLVALMPYLLEVRVKIPCVVVNDADVATRKTCVYGMELHGLLFRPAKIIEHGDKEASKVYGMERGERNSTETRDVCAEEVKMQDRFASYCWVAEVSDGKICDEDGMEE